MADLQPDDKFLINRAGVDYQATVNQFAKDINIHVECGGGADSNHTHSYNDLTDKPTEFPPSGHNHAWADISGKPTFYPPMTHTHSYNDLTDKPSTYTKIESDAKFMPLDLSTLPPLS